MSGVPIVSALTYYPVKGFQGIPVDRAELTATGLRHDREFMLVDATDGGFLSQRVVPAMAACAAALREGALVLAAPGEPEIEVGVAADGPRREVSLFGRWFGEGVDQGEAAAEWCSRALGRPARLVRVPPDHDRDGWGLHPGKVGFADAHAVLVTSTSSLEDLNTRVRAAGGDPVPMDRFRPNIVVDGWAEPHTEDRVEEVEVGGARLGFSTRAARCAVPTVDQATGVKAGPEPIRTLATYRREPELGNRVSFGAKFAVLRGGVVAVGDEVSTP